MGWDKSGNTYWLFDDNRLWIQRTPPLPPAPPKKSSLKAKRALKRARNNTSNTNNTSKSRSKSKAKPAPKPKPSTKPSTSTPRPKGPLKKRELTPPPEEVSGSRRRAPVKFYGNPTPTALALKRGAGFPPSGGTPAGGRTTRSRARISGINDNGPDQSAATEVTPSKAVKKTQLPLGTRVSRRLRNVDDEWQQVPDEWLDGVKEDAADTKDGTGNGEEEGGGDDESELSDLTDEEEHAAEVEAAKARESQENGQIKTARRKAVKEEVEGKEEEEVVDTDSPLSELSETEPIVEQDDEEDEYNPDEEIEQEDAIDVDETEPKQEQEEEEDNAEEDAEEEDDIVKAAIKEASSLPEGFIEWETVRILSLQSSH